MLAKLHIQYHTDISVRTLPANTNTSQRGRHRTKQSYILLPLTKHQLITHTVSQLRPMYQLDICLAFRCRIEHLIATVLPVSLTSRYRFLVVTFDTRLYLVTLDDLPLVVHLKLSIDQCIMKARLNTRSGAWQRTLVPDQYR